MADLEESLVPWLPGSPLPGFIIKDCYRFRQSGKILRDHPSFTVGGQWEAHGCAPRP
jgi:hypothetical protein